MRFQTIKSKLSNSKLSGSKLSNPNYLIPNYLITGFQIIIIKYNSVYEPIKFKGRLSYTCVFMQMVPIWDEVYIFIESFIVHW